MHRTIGLAVGLAACGGAPPAPAPEVLLEPDVVLFEQQVQDPTGVRGSRVWGDGRVEVAAGGTPTAPIWVPDGTLPPEAVAAIRARLASPAVRALPALLPDDPRAPEGAPRATWSLRVEGETTRIESAGWSGIRPAPLDAVAREIAKFRPKESVNTTWTLSTGDGTTTVALPCAPAQAPALRGVGAALAATDLPATAPSPAPPLVEVRWDDGGTTWTTTLHADGALHRVPVQGDATWHQLPPERLAKVEATLTNTAWSEPAALCR